MFSCAFDVRLPAAQLPALFHLAGVLDRDVADPTPVQARLVQTPQGTTPIPVGDISTRRQA